MNDSSFLELIGNSIGIEFDKADEPLLRQSFTHPSLKGDRNYERLEFLGDRVLSMIVAHWLYDLYPEEKEGHLSIVSARMVSKETLLRVATKLQLADFLDFQPAMKIGERAMESAMVNSLEAFLAALYLTKGLGACEKFVKEHWQDFLLVADGDINNPRGQLQEWMQAKKLTAPVYKLVATGGNDHEPTFTIELDTAMPELGIITATAKTKKLAMAKAALDAMTRIKKLNL